MIKRYLDRLTTGFNWLAGLAMLFMMLQIGVDVLSKYLFNYPFLWTTDVVASYLMVAIVFLPLAGVERQNSQIRVELLIQHMNYPTRRVMVIFTTIVSIVYFAGITWRTWGDALDKYRIGEYVMGDSQVTVWPGRFFLPLGCGLLTIYLFYKLWQLIADKEYLKSEEELAASGEMVDE
ncbi:TRAP transporter small permease [Sneathiella sp.]|uniref:TRAP transporter small permease n=1 Tax=Sneathiella sp. TaxID=1964365 RepID=UPI002FE13089